jgi:hypothetical protein
MSWRSRCGALLAASLFRLPASSVHERPDTHTALRRDCPPCSVEITWDEINAIETVKNALYGGCPDTNCFEAAEAIDTYGYGALDECFFNGQGMACGRSSYNGGIEFARNDFGDERSMCWRVRTVVHEAVHLATGSFDEEYVNSIVDSCIGTC